MSIKTNKGATHLVGRTTVHGSGTTDTPYSLPEPACSKKESCLTAIDIYVMTRVRGRDGYSGYNDWQYLWNVGV